MKRKLLILASALVAAGIAYVLTMNQPKQYRSSMQVATGYATSEEIKVRNETPDYIQTDTKFNNVIVTFTSPVVLNLLAYKLVLHDLTSPTPYHSLSKEKAQELSGYINKDSALKAFKQKSEHMIMLNLSNPEDKKLAGFLSYFDYDIGTLTDNLKVNRLQRTDFLQIEYVSDNPDLSAFAVNTIFDEFIRYYGNNRGQRAAESVDTLKSILERKKQVLDEKNNLLKQAGLVDIEIQNAGDLDIISNLETALTDARSQLTTQQSSLKKVNQRLKALSNRPAEKTDNEEILLLRKAMNDAYSDYLKTNDQEDLKKYNNLKTQYQQKVLETRTVTDKDPVTERNDLLTQRADLEIDIQTSLSNISSLQSRINALKGNVSSTAAKGAAMESLVKEADLANKEYLDAVQRYNAATDIKGTSVNNFRVIVPGQPAVSPEGSKRPLIIIFAGLAALFLSIGIIVLLAYLDSSVRTPMIFSRNVNLKLISLINFMNLKNRNITDVISNKAISTDEAEHKRNNIFRESLRKLRYEIETSGKKIFLFTSTKKGQGKTTIIQALSYSMSLSKKEVLIIDTNFCNNDLTVQLNADPVLEKIIPYKSDNKALIEQVKVFSKDLGLGSIYAIGSEGGDYTPSEILPRENILHHLNSLTSDFDYIFLEGPPLNDFSDSKELAQYVDGVIAVFSAQDVIKQIDKQSIAFFKELNGKFTGSILNMVDLNDINVV